jgi:hypothetical protein
MSKLDRRRKRKSLDETRKNAWPKISFRSDSEAQLQMKTIAQKQLKSEVRKFAKVGKNSKS